MTTLLVGIAIYLLMGILTAALFTYRDWQEGEDFTVGDLSMFALRALIWPAALLLLIEDKMQKPLSEIVLLRGSRSARMLKELRKDGD